MGRDWRKGQITRLPCSEDGCDTLAHARGKCGRHYELDRRRAGLVPARIRPPKPRREMVTKEPRPKPAPKRQGPRGIAKSIPMTGRVSPSPFPDGGTSGRGLDRLPDGYLSGSKRIGSYVGIKHRTYFMLHPDDECFWIELARCRVTDVWEHPEVGRYALDRETLNRTTVKFCSTCQKRLAQAV